MVKHKCNYCQYESQHKWVVKRHMEFKHLNKAPRAPTTVVSAAACESKDPSPIQMVVSEIRPPATNLVHHPAPNQHQQYNDKRLRSSEESTDKFERFYQAVHGKTPNISHFQKKWNELEKHVVKIQANDEKQLKQSRYVHYFAN